MLCSSLIWPALLAMQLPCAEVKDPFVFQNGDRVVLLGSTLIEREQKFGDWELALTKKNADKSVIFRNLGWSGDTVWAESRGSFDGPKAGYARMIELLKELKPTVVIVCYGHNESDAGPQGTTAFTTQMTQLLDDLATLKARIVVMSPTPYEDVSPLKNSQKRNLDLASYGEIMKNLAAKKSGTYFDLMAAVQKLETKTLTENGIHYGAKGYAATAKVFFAEAVDTLSSADQQLRDKIVAKNELFFHRWRPQNQTYLFGFRKHEQGQNAKEIVEFDPLIEKAEAEIAQLLKQHSPK